MSRIGRMVTVLALAGLGTGWLTLAGPAASAAPTGPTITSPTTSDATTTQTPLISGIGLDAGDKVTVVYTSSASTNGSGTACNAVVNNDAADDYSCTPSSPLPVGSVSLQVTEMVAGVVVSGTSVTITVGVAPTLTSPASGATVSTPTPTFAGAGQPSDLISIKSHGAAICSTTVNSSGAFSCPTNISFEPGAQAVTVTEADPDGADSTTIAAVPFMVVGPATSTSTTTPAVGNGGSSAPVGSTSAGGSDSDTNPSSVASGTGGEAAPSPFPYVPVVGLGGAGLALLIVAWRRRRA